MMTNTYTVQPPWHATLEQREMIRQGDNRIKDMQGHNKHLIMKHLQKQDQDG